jgi:hypothetical protein
MAVADHPSAKSELGNSNSSVGHRNGNGNINLNRRPSLADETEEKFFSAVPHTKQPDFDMQELFGESRAGMIWRTAAHLSPAGVNTPNLKCRIQTD